MEEAKQSVNKKLIAAVAIILVVALLAGSLGGLWYRKNKGDSQVEAANSVHKSLAAGFTDVKIKDKSTAVEAVQSVKDQLGMTNAEDELEVVGTRKVNGDKYYRMQQYHNGIPVYGRNVVVGADEDGNSLSLTTNYEPIGGELSADPSVDEATVRKNVEKQLEKVSKTSTTKAQTTTTKTTTETTEAATTEETTEETTASSSGNFVIDALEQAHLVYYTFLNKESAVLSYALTVRDDATGLWEAIVDANTGEVLDMLSLTFTSSANVKDTAGNSFTAAYRSSEDKYLLANENWQTYIETVNGGDSENGANVIMIDSDDNVFGNTQQEQDLEYEKASQYYQSLLKIQSQFKSLCGAKADKVLVAYYNDGNDYGNNGYASSDEMQGTPYIKNGTPVGIISIGTRKDVNTTDLLAHEYMHRVEQNKVGMLYRSESGALMEAYSDVFGELIEEEVSGSADWVHNGIRSLANPLDTDNPAAYRGENWGSTASDEDHGYVHQNSTAFSHAGYLMRTGVDGSAELNSKQLATLWYEALNRFVQDETFQQAAEAIYATAQDQARFGRLTNDQVDTVAAAFASVGLSVDGTSAEQKNPSSSEDKMMAAYAKEAQKLEDQYGVMGSADNGDPTGTHLTGCVELLKDLDGNGVPELLVYNYRSVSEFDDENLYTHEYDCHVFTYDEESESARLVEKGLNAYHSSWWTMEAVFIEQDGKSYLVQGGYEGTGIVIETPLEFDTHEYWVDSSGDPHWLIDRTEYTEEQYLRLRDAEFPDYDNRTIYVFNEQSGQGLEDTIRECKTVRERLGLTALEP